MNKMIVIGNLTRDPELRRVGQENVAVTTFTVGVRKPHVRSGANDSDFIRVTCWRGLAETCCKYLHKGSKVAVTGYAKAGSYTRQDGSTESYIEVTAEDLEFCDRRENGTTEAAAQAAPETAPEPEQVDEEPPF